MNTFNEFELNRIKKLYSDELNSRLQRFASGSNKSALPAQQSASTQGLAATTKSADRPTARSQQACCLGSSPFVDPLRYQRALAHRPRSSARAKLGRSASISASRFGRALFDFQAKSGRELSLRRGDLVEMLELLDHSWARVEDCQSGLQGLVPLNYIDYSVGCAVAKRDVSGQQRVTTRLACVPGSKDLLAEAHLLPMSKGEPITLIRRLSGHWYEASNTRQVMGLVWSNDLDIIKQPVLTGLEQQTTPSPLQAGTSARPRGHRFTHELDERQSDQDEDEMLILSSGERVLARRRARSASGARPHPLGVDCCAPPLADSASRTANDADPHHRRLPRRSSSSPFILSAAEQAPPEVEPARQQQVARLCRAKFPYKPRQADELELQAGDLLAVLHECDDGWLLGSSYTSKLVGSFPGNFVEFI